VRKHLPILVAYVALLILALPVPLLHHYRTDAAIASRRPVIMHADGRYTPMLMPTHLISLRYLGQMSWAVPFVVVVMFALSFWVKDLTRLEILFLLAICQCAFTTLYALCATLALQLEWLIHPG
jgi:hypothetical protein